MKELGGFHTHRVDSSFFHDLLFQVWERRRNAIKCDKTLIRMNVKARCDWEKLVIRYGCCLCLGTFGLVLLHVDVCTVGGMKAIELAGRSLELMVLLLADQVVLIGEALLLLSTSATAQSGCEAYPPVQVHCYEGQGCFA